MRLLSGRSRFRCPTLAGGHGTPEIDIQLLPIDNPPKGIGEGVLPVITSCVGNAIFRLTGKRFRDVPLLPSEERQVTHRRNVYGKSSTSVD